MAKVSEVRNAMEHRYFKVLDWADENQERLDKLAYTISFDIFEKLTISLLRYAREAIILLIKAVFVEEYNRRKDMGDRIIMPMHTSPYEDEWKQIFW